MDVLFHSLKFNDMRLYELLIMQRIDLSGRIWCTDGSLIDPRCLRRSGKKAYGYALNNTTLVSLTRSNNGMAWAPSNSPFFYNYNFTGAGSLTDGVVNSNFLKSQDGFSPSSNCPSFNCPAVYYGCSKVNAGKVSYMPARDELLDLYKSIMSGRMKDDLITAGIYTTSCNYRNASDDFSTGWCNIWSSSQCSDSSYGAWIVYSNGGRNYGYKNSTNVYVIPFFKIE